MVTWRRRIDTRTSNRLMLLAENNSGRGSERGLREPLARFLGHTITGVIGVCGSECVLGAARGGVHGLAAYISLEDYKPLITNMIARVYWTTAAGPIFTRRT